MPKISDAKRSARRNEILVSAAACFTRNGVHPTSVQDICRQAGMSIGGLYKYFSSKAEIIEALFLESDEMNRQVFEELVRARPQDASGCLRQVMEQALAGFAAPGASDTVRLALALQAEAGRDPKIAAWMRSQRDYVVGAFSKGIAAAQGEGALPADLQPDEIAVVLVALFEGLKPQLALNPELDVARYKETLRALLPGLFA